MDLADSFHNHLNSIDPDIQFTVEKESGGQLPFLDILLTHNTDLGLPQAHHMDQYLGFQCHHLAAHKRVVARTLMHRAETLSLSGMSRVEEEKHITKALQRVTGILQASSAGTPAHMPNQRPPDSSERRASLTLPYLSYLSESLCRVLRSLAIQVTFRPFWTL